MRYLRFHSQKAVPMNAYPTFPATPFGLVCGLIYGIVAFLALRICACGLGTIP